jgi:predicted nucleic-acid-binding protein
MAKKPQTNVQLVTHMMEYSQVGALKQAFIIEAISQYSKQIVESEPWTDGVITHAAWKAAAQECITEIENRV